MNKLILVIAILSLAIGVMSVEKDYTGFVKKLNNLFKILQEYSITLPIKDWHIYLILMVQDYGNLNL